MFEIMGLSMSNVYINESELFFDIWNTCDVQILDIKMLFLIEPFVIIVSLYLMFQLDLSFAELLIGWGHCLEHGHYVGKILKSPYQKVTCSITGYDLISIKNRKAGPKGFSQKKWQSKKCANAGTRSCTRPPLS